MNQPSVNLQGFPDPNSWLYGRRDDGGMQSASSVGPYPPVYVASPTIHRRTYTGPIVAPPPVVYSNEQFGGFESRQRFRASPGIRYSTTTGDTYIIPTLAHPPQLVPKEIPRTTNKPAPATTPPRSGEEYVAPHKCSPPRGDPARIVCRRDSNTSTVQELIRRFESGFQSGEGSARFVPKKSETLASDEARQRVLRSLASTISSSPGPDTNCMCRNRSLLFKMCDEETASSESRAVTFVFPKHSRIEIDAAGTVSMRCNIEPPTTGGDSEPSRFVIKIEEVVPLPVPPASNDNTTPPSSARQWEQEACGDATDNEEPDPFTVLEQQLEDNVHNEVHALVRA